MDIEPGQFPCINCGADTQVFYSSKTGDKLGWSCLECKAHGWFMGLAGKEKAMLLEA